ncbi:hypothetical protein OsccyDRAFT_1781 [Leptolyngbyaceae cyanobacterium JSC-12]|nr:hypothetical protein OsccyDRAFT_1781 [Leptolyngbyaceae cyanobacterium JSC-12]
MSAELKQRLLKVAILVIADLTLNLVDMDTMANYSEFVFGQESAIASTVQPAIALQIS